MNERRVVVDANIAFKALNTSRGDLLAKLKPPLKQPRVLLFYSPKFLIVELFKHKERIIRASNVAEEEFSERLLRLVNLIEFVNEGVIPIGTWVEAHRICNHVDPKDTPYVALSLHLNAEFWTEDATLIKNVPAGAVRFVRTVDLHTA